MKRVLVVLVCLGVVSLLTWVAMEGFEEMERERGLELSIEVPQRLARDDNGRILVTLTREEQEKAGLRLAEIVPGKRRRQEKGFGTVRSPDSLLALDKEKRMTAASIVRARVEADRVRKLFENGTNVSKRTVEVAEEELTRLEAVVSALDRRLRSEWGAGVAGLDPVARSALIDRLVGGESVYVDAHLLPGSRMEGLPESVEIRVPGMESTRRADEVAVAPRVASKLQGLSFLLRVDQAGSALRPGVPVTIAAAAPGPPEEGVVVPASAVVRFQGAAWIYVRLDEKSFTRKEIQLDRPFQDGWLAMEGFTPGERVVVTGAQLLLSEERRASIRLEEEEE